MPCWRPLNFEVDPNSDLSLWKLALNENSEVQEEGSTQFVLFIMFDAKMEEIKKGFNIIRVTIEEV